MNPFVSPVSVSRIPVQAGYIFMAIFAILTLASVIGQWLKRKKGANHPTIANLNARIYAWWIMTLVLLLAFWFGKIGAVILFFLISFAALREFMTLVYKRRSDYKVMVVCFYLLLPVQYYFVLIEWYGMFSIFIPVYGFLLLPIIASLSGKTEQFLERTAKIQWVAMISIFCLSHIPALMNLRLEGFPQEQNVLLLIFMIAVVQSSDVLQYVWGKTIGKRKIMPALSPSKTVAGTVGGIASATLMAVLMSPITPFAPWPGPGSHEHPVTPMMARAGQDSSERRRIRGSLPYGELCHWILGLMSGCVQPVVARARASEEGVERIGRGPGRPARLSAACAVLSALRRRRRRAGRPPARGSRSGPRHPMRSSTAGRRPRRPASTRWPPPPRGHMAPN